ncbi:MAG TPA: flagellar assembly protein FliX [Stellaceae bacterium]|nr:flagellar assembly protein FliX [Stellaceae bacterium]
MRIEQSRQLQSAAGRRPAQAPSGDGRFAEELSGDTGTGAASMATATTTVDNLFMLQEVSDSLTGRRRAVQRGNRLLDRLDDIRLGLLTGSLSRGQLESLRQLSREQVDLAGDPELAAILDEIELRVAVELAKLDQVA